MLINNKNNLINAIEVAGVLLIILATIGFSSYIPSLDEKINEANKEYLTFTSEIDSWLNLDESSIIVWNMFRLINALGQEEVRPSAWSIHESAYKGQRQAIKGLAQTIFGEAIPKNWIADYENMTWDELQYIKVNVYREKKNKVEEILEKERNLTEKKNNVTRAALIMQILGLVLLQTGIILQRRWKL